MALESDLLQSPRLSLFRQLIQKEPSLLIEGLWDAPKAALILLAARATGKHLCIISDEKKSNRLIDNLEYFGLTPFFEFPAWETLPGEEFSPSPDIVGKRLEILYQLAHSESPQILICSLQACLQKVIPIEVLKNACQIWKVGLEIPFSSIEQKLTDLGYRRQAVAADKGEFAVRSGIIDLFPLSSSDPYRIEFFGDLIDSIRTYDPVSQKSIAKIDQFFLSPASELLKNSPSSDLLDYFGKNTLVIFDDLLALEDKYAALKRMHFSSVEALFKSFESMQTLFWTEQRMEELSEVKMAKKVGRSFYSGKEPLQELSFQFFDRKLTSKRWLHPFREISDFFSASDDLSATTPSEILQGIHRYAKSALTLRILCQSDSEEKSFQNRLQAEDISLPKNTFFDRAYLSSGFVIEDCQYALLPMTELTHRYRIRRQKWRSTYHTPAAEFHELLPGDIVVHFHQGIGKYLGMEKKPNHQGVPSEFLAIEYAEGSKFYVPISSAYLVSRYIGAKEETPILNELGTKRWHHQRTKAQQAILGYARELLHMNAEREVHGGFQFPEDSLEMQEFEKDFPFTETEDQALAIAAVKADMQAKRPMDRLICGDVGYGKTEVAMRAAFKAVADGKKQVAILVPTTVLAMQHLDTFRERMVNYPINIAGVSRFFSQKAVRETLEKVEEGKIDILIGTHRMIGKDVRFKDLGLIIIDEEQRFGVRAKEHLKKIKTGVDCLTLSATPIPRTLYMSLMGVKEISTINTPPHDRLPIKSHLCEKDPSLIQNALLRELSRDGQAFIIHNRIETIFRESEEIKHLLPQSRVLTAHGQMSADEIDSIFHAFKSGEADILIATTIIENGVDIPNANTILIDRADQFGLSDLYQMRGRVGRWNRPAYAYFLVPKGQKLNPLSQKRLHALIESSGFGGGMKIAMRDLEIRGAGDILGTEQSGQISSIGFHLYCKLLKKTVDALRKKANIEFIETKMEFPFNARLPETYINAPNVRMELYHRLGEALSNEEVDLLLAEMKDRFGPPPEEVIWLYHLTRLRILASRLGYTLLKIENLTFTVERPKDKQVERRMFSIFKVKHAAELEEMITAKLINI